MTGPENRGRGPSASPAATSTNTRRLRRPQQVLVAITALCLPVVSGACSSSSDPADPVDTVGAVDATNPGSPAGLTTAPDRATLLPPGPLTCESHPPGVVLSREQAIVLFDPERVCPGYVTVLVGTPVSFVNQGDAVATVTVTETAATGELGATLLDVAVGPGEYVEYTPVTAGFLAFATDALPSFRGTVEVRAAEPA